MGCGSIPISGVGTKLPLIRKKVANWWWVVIQSALFYPLSWAVVCPLCSILSEGPQVDWGHQTSLYSMKQVVLATYINSIQKKMHPEVFPNKYSGRERFAGYMSSLVRRLGDGQLDRDPWRLGRCSKNQDPCLEGPKSTGHPPLSWPRNAVNLVLRSSKSSWRG